MQKIIIVEDDQFLREELENIYHKAGYEVCCVTDFPETGAVCEAEHPDLLVLDLGLPGISGFALCKEIRKKGSLPILVLTSRDKMQDELKALELGADEYLTKPCHKDRLLARTENLLKRAMDIYWMETIFFLIPEPIRSVRGRMPVIFRKIRGRF